MGYNVAEGPELEYDESDLNYDDMEHFNVCYNKIMKSCYYSQSIFEHDK